MSERSTIEWTDSTFNAWIGCTKISPGCDHCYAERDMDIRRHRVKWGAGQARSRTSAAYWKQPLRWNADAIAFVECLACGHRRHRAPATACPACSSWDYKHARRRVFCASLADVFDNAVDPAWRLDLIELIAKTPHLDWLLLTKRIGNAEIMLDEALAVMSHGLTRWGDAPWPNVWLGATIVNQEEADRDVPKLLAMPAAVRFLSCEPLLGSINLRRVDAVGHGFVDALTPGYFVEMDRLPRRGLDWVIAGGESGPHARPAHPDWIRSLRDQCAAADVPFMFKQWGEHAPNWLTENDGTKIAGSEWTDRMGKKAAGRSLDGRVHGEFPVMA